MKTQGKPDSLLGKELVFINCECTSDIGWMSLEKLKRMVKVIQEREHKPIHVSVVKYPRLCQGESTQ